MWASHGLDRFCVRPYSLIGPELQVSFVMTIALTCLVTNRQTSCNKVVAQTDIRMCFALFVPSCCDKSGTTCYHLVARLMTV
jgi:hypothetical protein